MQILIKTTDILFQLMIDPCKLQIILLNERGNSVRNCVKIISKEKYQEYGSSFLLY